jgi:TolA-binding protein
MGDNMSDMPVYSAAELRARATTPQGGPPVDPNIHVPDAVKSRSAQITGLYNQTPAPAPGAVTPQDNPPVLHLPAASAAPVSATPPSGRNWENDYKAMEGRFRQANAEVAQLRQDVQNLSQQMQRPPAPPPPPPQPLITEKDVKEYGEEFFDVVGRAARAAMEPVLGQMRQNNIQLHQRQYSQAQEAMYRRLDQECPDWESINGDPQFLAWLRLRDPLSGTIRKALLDRAFADADASRILGAFNGFKETAGQQQAAPPAVQPPQVTLTQFAAPGNPNATVTNPGGDKPIFTTSQINAFWHGVRRGQWAGREAEVLERM